MNMRDFAIPPYILLIFLTILSVALGIVNLALGTQGSIGGYQLLAAFYMGLSCLLFRDMAAMQKLLDRVFDSSNKMAEALYKSKKGFEKREYSKHKSIHDDGDS